MFWVYILLLFWQFGCACVVEPGRLNILIRARRAWEPRLMNILALFIIILYTG